MKKKLFYLGLAVITAATLVSCNKGGSDNNGNDVTASKIKTISVDYGNGVEGYKFYYNTNGTIKGIADTWEGTEVDSIIFDYSVSGKLSITKEGTTTVYVLDSKNRIVKEIWDDSSWASYEYDSNGFLDKVSEYWDAADHVKTVITNDGENVTMITSYDDSGNITKYKTFTYTQGENVNDLQQTNAVDSNWKVIGGLFGVPSARLVDYLEYWAPGSETSKSKTTITYTFDTENRPATIVRAGDGWEEDYAFTYYEDAK
jgi:hypothetical protein